MSLPNQRTTNTLLLATLLAAAPAVRGGIGQIDPERTSIVFTQPYLGLMKVTGRFSGVTGEIGEKPDGRMSLRIRIPVDSVHTGSNRVDAFLKGPGFFAVADYPEATFVSDDVVRGADGTLKVTGVMALRGVRRPVAFIATPLRGGGGFTAAISLSRSEFGVGRGAIGVPDRITLQVTAVQMSDEP